MKLTSIDVSSDFVRAFRLCLTEVDEFAKRVAAVAETTRAQSIS